MPAIIGTTATIVCRRATAQFNWRPLLQHLNALHFNGTFIMEITGSAERQATLHAARRGRSFLRDLTHRLRVPG